jgi:sterol desaturase/sphingolipid hydroxylase (fatty acid hydroxylase superfamily)
MSATVIDSDDRAEHDEGLTPDIDAPHLTAPANAVPTRNGKGTVTLSGCARVFARQPSPPYLLGAVLVAVGLRIPQGAWSWRDLVVAAGLIAVTPFVEWLIHVYLLHSPPFKVFGRRVEMISAREHRAHHEAPGKLGGVLLPPVAVIVFALMIAAVAWGMSFPISMVLGGGHRLAGATTGLVVAYAILASYEWTHFLIHTPYRPKRRYFKAIWRNHRLHHFKNERYWFGVTSTIGDRVIGTLPDGRSVPRSATARSLHADR